MTQLEIDGIRAEVDDLIMQTSKAKDRLKTAQMNHAGVKIGTRIIISDGPKNYEAEITGWRIYVSNSGWPMAKKINKDGAVSKTSIGYIKDWRVK